MSNLGAYQWMTTTAKKVGGPINLLILTALGGAAVYKCSEIGVKKTMKVVKAQKDKKKPLLEKKDSLYVVTAEGLSNEKLKFSVGDQFKVLEKDGEAVLIEKIGDANNPYFVSATFLSEISDYKNI